MKEQNFDASNIRVNIVELATNLAQDATMNEFGLSLDSQEELEGVIFIDETHEDYDEDCSKYTEEAQEVFNRWYDYFYGKIEEAKS